MMQNADEREGRSCSEDPDVKGTETLFLSLVSDIIFCCSEDPDVKGTETGGYAICLTTT